MDDRDGTWPGKNVEKADAWHFARADAEAQQKVERDTHFQGFARLLWDELQNEPIVDCDGEIRTAYPSPPEISRAVELLLARRAYDLVYHAFDYCDTWESDLGLSHSYDWDALLHDIPDLTTWPEQSE